MQMRTPIATPPRSGAALVKIDPMVDGVEFDQADKNKIDRNDVVQQARDDENEQAGDNRDNRRDVGSGDNHGFFLGLGKIGWDAMGDGVKWVG
jgi:hypothetical protein